MPTIVCSLRRHDGSGLAHGDEARLLFGIVMMHAPGRVASSTQAPGGHHLEGLRHNSGCAVPLNQLRHMAWKLRELRQLDACALRCLAGLSACRIHIEDCFWKLALPVHGAAPITTHK